MSGYRRLGAPSSGPRYGPAGSGRGGGLLGGPRGRGFPRVGAGALGFWFVPPPGAFGFFPGGGPPQGAPSPPRLPAPRRPPPAAGLPCFRVPPSLKGGVAARGSSRGRSIARAL